MKAASPLSGGPQLTSRRSLLKALAAAPVLAPTVGMAGWTARRPRTLVLLHLAGGNDGLNTLIPYRDPAYYELRPTLSAAAREALPISDELALHPALRPLAPLHRAGTLAFIQGVGYTPPDYSHVGSRRIWATGSRDPQAAGGWWDRVLAELPGGHGRAVCLGARRSPLVASADGALVRVVPGACRTGETLMSAAKIAASARPPALVLASVDGFDTHVYQLERHAEMLGELAHALAAFQKCVDLAGIADRVLLAAWSEFGRRPAENAGGGSDHGAAGPVLLLGRSLRGGVHGQRPSLTDTDFGNLIATVDFRDVYAALATQWLQCPIAEHAANKELLLV